VDRPRDRAGIGQAPSDGDRAQPRLRGRPHPSDRHIEYYRERARGGIALLVTEQHAAHPLSLGSFYHCCTAWDDCCVPQFAKLADAVHEHGARQFIQLMVTGVQDKGSMMTEWHPLWGASRIPSYLHNEVPVVMARDEIRSVVEGYAHSARNVRLGGLDGVEIHGAHSYLVAQFLSPFYNRRSDAYGGSPIKRCRLALEIGEAVREASAGAIAVGLRLSYDEFMGDRGITAEESASRRPGSSTSSMEVGTRGCFRTASARGASSMGGRRSSSSGASATRAPPPRSCAREGRTWSR
jgi:2,4-dienoyl-CoA reductase-like NADH-dependent reductase (Old Yellow Enzyme family)